MAITYPTSLDTFTNPTSADTLASPDHATQHANINDAVEALEAKVAIGNTVLGTYTAYTPTFPAGVTVGNGTFSSAYATVNDFTHYYGTFTLGSTSALIVGSASVSLPTSAHSSFFITNFPGFNVGPFTFYDTSATAAVYGVGSITSATVCRFYVMASNLTYTSLASISSSVPFTWATGDTIQWNLTYRTA